MTQTNNLASYIWSLADLLRGDFKQSQYGRFGPGLPRVKDLAERYSTPLPVLSAQVVELEGKEVEHLGGMGFRFSAT